jgi:hypothetical protein
MTQMTRVFIAMAFMVLFAGSGCAPECAPQPTIPTAADSGTDTGYYVPQCVPVRTTTTPPQTGRCYVNGYRRSNGTYVSGYWRNC